MSNSTPQARRVYDPLLRLLHWVIALSVVALIVTSSWPTGLSTALMKNPVESAHSQRLCPDGGFADALAVGARRPVQRTLARSVAPRPVESQPQESAPAERPSRGHDPIASLAYLFAYRCDGADGRHRAGALRQRIPDRPARRLAGNMPWLEDVLGEPHEVGFALMLALSACTWLRWYSTSCAGERVRRAW